VGYNVYFVKSENWFDEKNQFSEAEWDAVRREHSFEEWVHFDRGQITAKNPTDEQIGDLVALAKARGYRVQGDDGEFYSDNGRPVVENSSRPAAAVPTGLAAQLSKMLGSLFGLGPKSAARPIQSCQFKVGDRVRTTFRAGGIVTEVDPSGNGGLGNIKVKFPDGEVVGFALIAHDLTLEDPPE
jgi:hypothetical protein